MDLLRYGITARTVEMVCFDAALERLSSLCPDLDINAYKKRVKKEYRAMLARTPDIGGSSLEKNLYVAAFVFSFYKAEPSCITPAIVDEMVTAVFDSPFMVKAHKNKKCTLFTESTQNKKRRERQANTRNTPSTGNLNIARARMNFIIPIPSVASVSWVKKKAASNLFPAFARWMKEAISMKAASCTVPKPSRRAMIAAISM